MTQSEDQGILTNRPFQMGQENRSFSRRLAVKDFRSWWEDNRLVRGWTYANGKLDVRQRHLDAVSDSFSISGEPSGVKVPPVWPRRQSGG
jgi:hypothetical protein